MRLNRDAYQHALRLIRDGKVNTTDRWEFTADDSNALLGDPPAWDAYSKWFLGIRPEENPETKARYAYPIGKNGKLYRSAIIAIKQRAAQQQHADIGSASARILREIDGEEAARVTVTKMSHVEQNMQWVQLIPLGTVRTVDDREFICDADDAKKVLDTFERRFGDLPVTVEHFPYGGAVGWIRGLELRLPGGEEILAEHGIWALVQWTGRGMELLSDRAFRAMSPELALDHRKPPHVVELLGASIVTNPAIDGLALVASRQGGEKTMAENAKNEKNITELEQELQTLRAALDGAQDEIAGLREQLAAEVTARRILELKASREVTPEIEAFAVQLLKLQPELFDSWVNLLPEKKLPPKPLGEPEKIATDSLVAEVFPGEAAVFRRAKNLAKERKISFVEALNEISGGEQ